MDILFFIFILLSVALLYWLLSFACVQTYSYLFSGTDCWILWCPSHLPAYRHYPIYSGEQTVEYFGAPCTPLHTDIFQFTQGHRLVNTLVPLASPCIQTYSYLFRGTDWWIRWCPLHPLAYRHIPICSGAQTGEYFGASLVTGDFNGDGQMDLIVGSPLYTFHKV